MGSDFYSRANIFFLDDAKIPLEMGILDSWESCLKLSKEICGFDDSKYRIVGFLEKMTDLARSDKITAHKINAMRYEIENIMVRDPKKFIKTQDLVGSHKEVQRY